MNPINSSQGGDGLGPAGPTPSQVPSAGTPSTPHTSPPQSTQAAAVNVIRTQIDALYGDSPVASPQQQQPAPAAHQSHVAQQHHQFQTDQWEVYHSAWQNYYQQYYDAYYKQKAIEDAAAQQAAQPVESKSAAERSTEGYFSSQPPQPEPEPAHTEDEFSKDQALFELREKLLGKVRTNAKKIRKSRHFVPIVAALTVVLVFVFVQYNRVFIATVNAYVSPGSVDPQNIVIDPSAGTAVGSDPRLIIPKINVDVPVLYDVGADHDSQMAAMEKGVAHFAIPGANSHPGEIGNTVLSGHSSNDLFDPGDYKFIFAQLEKLQTGDTIYANYKGTRYTYVITKKEVVLPTQVDKLIYPTDKPMLTLITCTPLGTAQKRLLVTAEQISPDPSAATAAPSGSGTVTSGDDSAAIPGSSPTLFERLFGAR